MMISTRGALLVIASAALSIYVGYLITSDLWERFTQPAEIEIESAE